MNRRTFVTGLGAALVGCHVSFDPNAEDVASIEQRITTWPDGTYATMRSTGVLYATHSYKDINYLQVIAAAAGTAWHAANPARFQVMLKAMNEAVIGLCGDAARQKYGSERNWCSEFTRWVYLEAGLTDVSYCAVRGRSACLGTQSLSMVGVTMQMVNLFSHFQKFAPASPMAPASVRPGDYLSLVGSEGPNRHSGIALAVSADYKWIWTVEGNIGDCMSAERRPYYTNGVLDSRICGVGNIDLFINGA
jgi:hypothetical protein